MRPSRSPWFRHAGESALHERDHRGGDHPIPFRTRQLSPPSPKVLQRQAAGGQGVALMQGASAYPGPSGPFFLSSGPQSPFLRLGPKPEWAFGLLDARASVPLAPCPLPRPVECSQRLTSRVPRRLRRLLETPVPPGSRPPFLESVKRLEHLTGSLGPVFVT